MIAVLPPPSRTASLVAIFSPPSTARIAAAFVASVPLLTPRRQRHSPSMPSVTEPMMRCPSQYCQVDAGAGCHVIIRSPQCGHGATGAPLAVILAIMRAITLVGFRLLARLVE